MRGCPSPVEVSLKALLLASSSWVLAAPVAHAQDEPDHAIHEELRALMRDTQAAINSGDIPKVLPLLTDDFEATSMTQDPVRGRAEVTEYFETWFGPDGYMKTLDMKLEADALTDLSADKSWGLVRGKGTEHYVAKNGDAFDFATRWTTVVERGDDGKWRVRAVHFGTNHLDNPVLTKVSTALFRYGVLGALTCLVGGFGAGWLLGKRRARRG
jgi:ketosteroid isomerase-like protein